MLIKSDEGRITDPNAIRIGRFKSLDDWREYLKLMLEVKVIWSSLRVDPWMEGWDVTPYEGYVMKCTMEELKAKITPV